MLPERGPITSLVRNFELIVHIFVDAYDCPSYSSRGGSFFIELIAITQTHPRSLITYNISSQKAL